MRVYQCLLFGFIPEEVVSDSIVDFVERMVTRQRIFKVKSVPENSDPARITKGIAGYYPSYGMAYLSDPDTKVGLTGIDIEQKRLVVSSTDAPFFDHRDSIVYSTPENTYIRGNYRQVLEEFKQRGYRMFPFVSQSIGDSLIRHRNFDKIKLGLEFHL
jgi:hypothetical protein